MIIFKLFLLLYFLGALWNAFLNQFSWYIMLKKPIRSKRTAFEIRIINNEATTKQRLIHFYFKTIEPLYDWKYILEILIISFIIFYFIN